MTEPDKYRVGIAVRTTYLEARSDPDNDHYVFAYTVTVTNHGTVTAQLMTRHWIITDGRDKVIEVRGEGVVGEQPTLRPGTSFRYTSGTVLETPVGSMHGSYQMVAEDGTRFAADIPAFTLSVPRTLH